MLIISGSLVLISLHHSAMQSFHTIDITLLTLIFYFCSSTKFSGVCNASWMRELKVRAHIWQIEPCTIGKRCEQRYSILNITLWQIIVFFFCAGHIVYVQVSYISKSITVSWMSAVGHGDVNMLASNQSEIMCWIYCLQLNWLEFCSCELYFYQ